MARFSKGSVNPDLAKERQTATFDNEPLVHLLDGGAFLTSRRREMEDLVLNDDLVKNGPDYYFLSRPEQYTEAMRKTARYWALLREHHLDSRADQHFASLVMFPNENSPMTLHTGMFMPTLEGQCTIEQKEKWIPLAKNLQIIGTYAQTELGHGTNVRFLETTCTYDPKTEEFVLHSPTLTSSKWWPGGLGKTCNYAIVMASLYSQSKCHGIHAFLVQLRHLDTHEPMPGITLGDIGPKFGFPTIDNGFLRFDHVRIPRDNMLMKYAQVLRDGTYVKEAKNDKLSYGSMVFIRAMVTLEVAGRGLAQAVTIAVRYSCVRHQSELKPGAPEPQIIEYQMQQYKLFPQIAAAYAFWFAGLKMRETYFMSNYDIQQGDTEALPELHASSSGIKAFTTGGAMSGIEQCRLACGGHGYSHASGIPKIYVQETAGCTYEGENTVLFLQTARYLMKAYQQSQTNQPLGGSVAYLADKSNSGCSVSAQLSSESLIQAYIHRAKRLVTRASVRISKLQSEGKEPHDAWNRASVDLVKAAEAHCHLYVVQMFVEKIAEVESAELVAVLTTLFQLYATYGISNNAADFIQGGYMSEAQLQLINEAVLLLMEKLRPNAVALVDAFDFPDYMLGSILGRYDGNVYENMVQWAKSSPLNKTEVHESFHKHLKPLMQLHSKL